MENYQKLKVQEKIERQKHYLFKEIFEECRKVFSPQKFEFFTKCMITNKAKIRKPSPQGRKNLNEKQNYQDEGGINQINPNILTMARKANFYGENEISELKKQIKNRRLLTTPTEQTSRKIKVDYFEDFQFYKKTKKQKDLISASQNRLSQTKQKMYSPEPLFLRPHRKQIPKIFFEMNTQSIKKNASQKKIIFARIKSTQHQVKSIKQKHLKQFLRNSLMKFVYLTELQQDLEIQNLFALKV